MPTEPQHSIVKKVCDRTIDRLSATDNRFICRVKPSRAALAVQPFILLRMTKRVLRSTTVLTADRLKAPLIRSPSQWPGTRRASMSSGR